jgi:signal transduction histidine kinase
MAEPVVRVLLIEDDPIDAESIRRNLDRTRVQQPIELDWVAELGSGLERLAIDAFDLVLLDLGLPDSTGLATLDLLREHDANVPVLVLTGARDLELDVEAGGAQAYLVKDDLMRSALARTVRQAIERQRIAREKLSSLGVLSAGVAMGFNRLLGSILENVEGAVSELGDASRLHVVRQRLHDIQREALRAEAMTSQLRDYAARSAVVGHRIDLSAFVLGAADLIDSLTPAGIEVRYDISSDVAAARASHLQLHQLLLALVMNSVEALKGQPGLISISTGIREVEMPLLRESEGSSDAKPGRYASLSVLDTGCGMNEATRRRAFDPFFTTKSAGRGLGLAAASGIARQCGAVITVASHSGEGSRFDVLFPHADATSEAAAAF